MAKAVRTAPARVPSRVPPRPPLAPRTMGRQGLVEYFRGVWDELKKVVWPAREELLRMTGIVIATVVLFGVIIGGADYLLSLGVKPLYTSSGSTTTTTSNTAITPTSTAAPATSATAAATPAPTASTSKTTPLP